jgi:acetyl esterase/lipase
MIARDRAHPPLAGQILLSPMLDPCAGTASLRKATNDAAECRWASGWEKYLSCPSNATHPYAVPSGSLRLSALAPALVLVGQDDAMRDEALTFAGPPARRRHRGHQQRAARRVELAQGAVRPRQRGLRGLRGQRAAALS